eukprot:1966805-Amphidinium_carterae.2
MECSSRPHPMCGASTLSASLVAASSKACASLLYWWLPGAACPTLSVPHSLFPLCYFIPSEGSSKTTLQPRCLYMTSVGAVSTLSASATNSPQST